MNKFAVAAALFAVVGSAQAVDPVFSVSRPVEQIISGEVGDSSRDANRLFWIDESTSTVAGIVQRSYYFAWEPAPGNGILGGLALRTVSGSITFDAPVVSLFSSRAALQGSASLQSPDVMYNYPLLTGLEFIPVAGDSLSIDLLNPNQINFSMTAAALGPGDHFRVVTAAPVPEPETYALMLAGLGLVGMVARRRKAQA